MEPSSDLLLNPADCLRTSGTNRPQLCSQIRVVSCSPELSRHASYDEDRLSERSDLNRDKVALYDEALSLVGISGLNHLHDSSHTARRGRASLTQNRKHLRRSMRLPRRSACRSAPRAAESRLAGGADGDSTQTPRSPEADRTRRAPTHPGGRPRAHKPWGEFFSSSDRAERVIGRNLLQNASIADTNQQTARFEREQLHDDLSITGRARSAPARRVSFCPSTCRPSTPGSVRWRS